MISHLCWCSTNQDFWYWCHQQIVGTIFYINFFYINLLDFYMQSFLLPCSFLHQYFFWLIYWLQRWKPTVSRILFSLRGFCVARLVMPGISFSATTTFASRAAFAARLVISGILFSISVTVLFRAAVVTNSVTLGVLFWISVIFVLWSLLD